MVLCHCTILISSISFSSSSASYLQQMYITPVLFKVAFFFLFLHFLSLEFCLLPQSTFQLYANYSKVTPFLVFLLISFSVFLTGCWTLLPISIRFIVYKPEPIFSYRCNFCLFLFFNTIVFPLVTQEQNIGIICYSWVSFTMTFSWLSNSLHANSLIYILHHSISMPTSLVKLISCPNSWTAYSFFK